MPSRVLRTLVVGDVHGCIEELDDLLRVSGFRAGSDRLILAGDLLDRGPDPVGALRRARELRAEVVMGNHEERHIRYRRHERRRALDPGHVNPMRPMPERRQKEHDSIRDEEWDWLESLPLAIRIDARWVVVHAGLEPGVALAGQRPAALLRLRYVNDGDGRMAALGEDLSRPPGTSEWGARWTGPESVLYGHHVTSEPRRHDPAPGVTCLGLDTGCCFGGALTGAWVVGGELAEIVSVPARAVHHRPAGAGLARVVATG